MKRRDFLKTLGVTGAALALNPNALFAANPQKKKHKNILLYVTDDQGADAGCYGNKIIKTPGLDLLAKNGVRFNNAFCTSSSCSPSRSVILTGKQSHTTGMYGLMHRPNHFSCFNDVKSLPVLLEKNGYETISGGKIHVGPEKVFHFNKYLKNREPKQFAEECKQAILNADKKGKPFFAYLCPFEPHRPFHHTGSDKIDPKDVIVPDFLPDTKLVREELARYYMSAQCADSGILKMMEILKETGHWDDTLIIYTSDQGIPFPGAKTNLYDPGIKVPFVVRDPFQSTKNVACDAMISLADITPGILDFAGVKYNKKDFFGRSFMPVLSEKKPENWDEVYASHTFHTITMYYPMRMIRQRRFKLIYNIAYELHFPEAWKSIVESKGKMFGKRTVEAYWRRPKFELYDLKNDPGEVKNLADDPKYAKVLNELKQKIKTFQKETNDPWLSKWTRK